MGVVTPRALLRLGVKQSCLRASHVPQDVADDDVNRVAPHEPYRFLDEQALPDLEKLFRIGFVHCNVAVGYARATDCAYLALFKHRLDVPVNRGNAKVRNVDLTRLKYLFDVEWARRVGKRIADCRALDCVSVCLGHGFYLLVVVVKNVYQSRLTLFGL